MTIHIVMGPPCSGKSTFVRDNAAPGTPRWDINDVATTLAGMETFHQITQQVIDVAMACRRGLLGWLLDPETPIPDVWLIHSRPADSMLSAFAARQAEFHLLDPGEEECIERCRRDGRPAETEDAIRAWYQNPPEVPEKKGGDSMKKKLTDASLKAGTADGLESGTMVAYASIFDNVDRVGDVVIRGAFDESLKEWNASGRPIPLLYGHDFYDPFSNIGTVTDAVEDEKGLKVTAKFDLDNPKAAQVYKLVKEKRISQMSFAYDVLDGSWAERDGQEVYELKKLKLHEVSVVPLGANSETEILEVKSWQDMAPDERAAMIKRAEPLLRMLTDSDAPPGAKATEQPTPEGTDPEGVSSCGDPAPIPDLKSHENALMARFYLLEKETN